MHDDAVADTGEKKDRWPRNLSLVVHAPVFLFVGLGLYTVRGGDPEGTAIFVLTSAPFLFGFALALGAKERPGRSVDRLLVASAVVSGLLGAVDLVWLLLEIASGFSPDAQAPGNLVYLFPFLGGLYALGLAILARPMGLLQSRAVRRTAWLYLAFVLGTVALASVVPRPVP